MDAQAAIGPSAYKVCCAIISPWNAGKAQPFSTYNRIGTQYDERTAKQFGTKT